MGLLTFPPVTHPLVRTHPDTGRQALFLGGGFMRYIEGMREPESDCILSFLRQHIENAALQCRWRWCPGDLAIWDERSTNHRSAADHFSQRRSIRRVEVRGERPYHRATVGASFGSWPPRLLHRHSVDRRPRR